MKGVRKEGLRQDGVEELSIGAYAEAEIAARSPFMVRMAVV